MRVRCEFCNSVVEFDEAEQVVLVLDKNATVNKEFVFRCNKCKIEDKKETLAGQKVRLHQYS